MILINKCFMKVWKIDKKEKYTVLRTSTGDKQQDGSYKNSNWNCKLVGKAHDKTLSEGDKIVVKSAKIENIYDKEKEKSWLNVIIFDFDNLNNEEFTNVDEMEVKEEELPF